VQGQKGWYVAQFDDEYNRGFSPSQVKFPSCVGSPEAAADLAAQISELKYSMDRHFSKHLKPEREFQQLVVRENNYPPISNESEYFIVDIEVAGILPGVRYDMLAVRWLRSQRKMPRVLVPALIEMKYGTGASTESMG
jgi:hypothetical protein